MLLFNDKAACQDAALKMNRQIILGRYVTLSQITYQDYLDYKKNNGKSDIQIINPPKFEERVPQKD